MDKFIKQISKELDISLVGVDSSCIFELGKKILKGSPTNLVTSSLLTNSGSGLSVGRDGIGKYIDLGSNGWIDTGLGSSDVDPKSDSYTLEILCVVESPSSSNAPIFGKSCNSSQTGYVYPGIYRTSSTSYLYQSQWRTTSSYNAISPTGYAVGCVLHAVLTADKATNSVYLYINGDQNGSLGAWNTQYVLLPSGEEENWLIGGTDNPNSNWDNISSMKVYHAAMYDESKSSSWVSDRYSSVSKNWSFKMGNVLEGPTGGVGQLNNSMFIEIDIYRDLEVTRNGSELRLESVLLTDTSLSTDDFDMDQTSSATTYWYTAYSCTRNKVTSPTPRSGTYCYEISDTNDNNWVYPSPTYFSYPLDHGERYKVSGYGQGWNDGDGGNVGGARLGTPDGGNSSYVTDDKSWGLLSRTSNPARREYLNRAFYMKALIVSGSTCKAYFDDITFERKAPYSYFCRMPVHKLGISNETASFGSWKWRIQIKDTGSSFLGSTFAPILVKDLRYDIPDLGQAGYYLQQENTTITQFNFYKITTGTGGFSYTSLGTTGQIFAESTDYDLLLTRDTSGVFNLYIKGGSYSSWTLVIGPVTDTSYVESSCMGFGTYQNDHISLYDPSEDIAVTYYPYVISTDDI